MAPRKKKPVAKDWYWEAEHDKIASDEDLRLIRSPAGNVDSKGLDCVGLWFLMLNLMSRSPRKGYLCDPVDKMIPLSLDDLSNLVGRPPEVVSLITEVILARRMFSKTDTGIIYSRGMVKREELRRIRSKSGRAGGKRSQVLLKQKFEQNTEQTLGIGIELNPLDSSNVGVFARAKAGANLDQATPAERVAFVYRSHVRGRRPEDVSVCIEAFEEMLAMGVTEEALTPDLKRGPPARDRSEFLWQIKNRAFKAAGISGATEGKLDGIAAFVQGNEDGYKS
jgi:hypothetical protein